MWLKVRFDLNSYMFALIGFKGGKRASPNWTSDEATTKEDDDIRLMTNKRKMAFSLQAHYAWIGIRHQ